MRIDVRIGLEAESVPALRGDPLLEPLLAPALEISPCPWITVQADSAAFDRVVARSRGGPGFRYTPLVEFEPAEVEGAEWLELRCAKFLTETPADYRHNAVRRAGAPGAVWLELRCAKFLAETPADYRHNAVRRAGAPWAVTGPARAHRVLRDLALTRLKLRPLQVAAVAEWIEEWVLPMPVLELLRSTGLSGFGTRPLRTGAGAVHPDFVQLDTDHVFPPLRGEPGLLVGGLLSDDPLVPAGGEPDRPPPAGARQYRAVGALVYDAGGPLPASDFARTAEALSCWGQATWVASRRVCELSRRHRLRGWRFEPLLPRGSDLHTLYLRRWRSFEEKVASHPAHRLW